MEDGDFLLDVRGDTLSTWRRLLDKHTDYLPLLWVDERWLISRMGDQLYLSFWTKVTGSYFTLVQMGHHLIEIIAAQGEELLGFVREAGWELDPAVTRFKLPEAHTSEPMYNNRYHIWVLVAPLELVRGNEQ